MLHTRNKDMDDSKFPIRNNTKKKAVRQHLKVKNNKNYQHRIPSPVKISLKFEGKIKTFFKIYKR